jgi:hypothetical protein
VSGILGVAHPKKKKKNAKFSEVGFATVFKWNMKFVRRLILAL